MVLFTKQNPDGTIKPVWRGAKRKVDDSGGNGPAFEFEHRAIRDRKRPFVMYMVQGLPPYKEHDLTRKKKNRELATAALQEADLQAPTYSLRLEHCRAIYAPGEKTLRPETLHPVAVDRVFLNQSGGSLIDWLLAMFEDQAQVLDALTTTLPAASWASAGPAGSTLTARPLGLHDDLWNAASRWIDLRIRTMTTATKQHLYTALGDRRANFNPETNRVERTKDGVNDDEKGSVRPEARPYKFDKPVDFRVSQMNNLVHGGDLELDLTLVLSWNDLGMRDRASEARRLYFVECFNEWYAGISYNAAAMIVRGAKEPSTPGLQYYFLNHRHFINKYLAVRSQALNSFNGIDPAESIHWFNCRNYFQQYILSLNDLAFEPTDQQRMDQAEKSAYQLYKRIAVHHSWKNTSIPTRALFWRPAEHMAWEWPGLDEEESPLTLSCPSTTWMPAPTGPGFAAAPVRRFLPNTQWPEFPRDVSAQGPAA